MTKFVSSYQFYILRNNVSSASGSKVNFVNINKLK